MHSKIFKTITTMEVKKKKATDVLAEMIENINAEELAETRKQMKEDVNNPIDAWFDKESRAYRDRREKYGVVDPVYLNEIEDAAYYGLMTGYNKAVETIQKMLKTFEKVKICQEAKPESPFKVGDKVVINCREEFATAYNGKEGTIINIFDLEKNHWGNIVVVLDNGMRNTFYESELIKK